MSNKFPGAADVAKGDRTLRTANTEDNLKVCFLESKAQSEIQSADFFRGWCGGGSPWSIPSFLR